MPHYRIVTRENHYQYYHVEADTLDDAVDMVNDGSADSDDDGYDDYEIVESEEETEAEERVQQTSRRQTFMTEQETDEKDRF
jgi:hypothetical protein